MDNDKYLEFIDSGSAFLEHHGVKGMKWGVRRYQPETQRGKVKGSNRLTEREKKLTRSHTIKSALKTFGLDMASTAMVSSGVTMALAMGFPPIAIGGVVLGGALGLVSAQQKAGENAKLAKDMAYEQNYSYKKK